MRCFLCAAACLLLGALPARADDPLRLIPAEADLAVKVERPRQLVESVLNLAVLQQLEKIEAFQEAIGSTNARQFYQLLAYFEKELGMPWPKLLDQFAGGGAVVAFKYGSQPTPALAVIQSKDEALLRKFLKVGLEVLQQELTRQDVKAQVEKRTHRGIDTYRIGPDLHFAVAGSALLVSNRESALSAGLDLHLDKDKKSLASLPVVAEARRTLPEDLLAWTFINMQSVRQLPGVKDAFDVAASDGAQSVLFGSWYDVLSRTPFVAGGLRASPEGYLTSFRAPRGREGSGPGLVPYLPPKGDEGSLPLLEPKRALVSTSYFWDVSKYWTDREKLFSETNRKQFEEFDKTSAPFLAGNNLSKLLTQAGTYQRFVAVHQDDYGYKTKPATRIPAFALAVAMRDKDFARSMETILRAAALFGGFQVKVKLVEEKVGDVNLIGYRFPEEPLPGDPTNIRFNFSPCFATVGDQFFAASTIELGREMIGLLQQEAKGPVKKSPISERTVIFSSGGADYLQAIEDQLLAQTILDRAVPPAEAKQQVKQLVDLVRNLGSVLIESHIGEREFRYDLKLNLKQKSK